jgi:predicted metal-dependent hydrolase
LRDRDVPYLLKRSQQRRSIVLTVDERGLTVSAPWRSTERRILAIIRDAEDWVLKKLATWSAYEIRHQTWAHGDTVRYLGNTLPLHLEQKSVATTAVLDDLGALRIGLPDPDNPEAVKAATVGWYRRHAQSNFAGRVTDFAPKLGVAAPRLLLSNAQSRWGSCNARREVRLNWRLIQAQQPTIDYVVVHELAHLIEMNHSRRFWDLVAAVCPHHKDARAELDRMGRYYMDI